MAAKGAALELQARPDHMHLHMHLHAMTMVTYHSPCYSPFHPHADRVRQALRLGPQTAAQLATALGISQPTVSRALGKMSAEVMHFRTGKTIHYVLRNLHLATLTNPVHRVDQAGHAHKLGELIPARPPTAKGCPGGCTMPGPRAIWAGPFANATPPRWACRIRLPTGMSTTRWPPSRRMAPICQAT